MKAAQLERLQEHLQRLRLFKSGNASRRSCGSPRRRLQGGQAHQPSLDKKQVQTLSSCHFIEHGENLVILGPPGVGKTHLAVGLGLKAIERGYRVLFTTAAAMIATLSKGLGDGRLDEKLKLYTVPRLLIVDEIGYLPIDQQGANLFFQLVSRRYE